MSQKTMVSVAKIIISKNVREVKVDDDLKRQGESLKVKQLQPVGILPDGTLLFGYRRVAAAKLVGMETIWVVLFESPPSEADLRGWQLAENCHREGLTAWEFFYACSELMCMNPTWQQQDLAKHLNFSAGRISQALAVRHCVEEVQNALRDGKITGMDAYNISKSTKENQIGKLNLILSSKGTDTTPGASTNNSSVRVKYPMPSGVTVTVVGKALDLKAYTTALNAALIAAKEADKQNIDIRTAERVWKDKAKAAEQPKGGAQ